MDFDLWWLLALPLFFGLGWLAARIDIRQVVSESRNVPASYFRGLNFLLNEQHDRAIEAFTEVTRVDHETAELHFALGGLFRRRGEVERAIRIHQNLVERADLDADQNLRALKELAEDFMRAGLYDRAETLYQRLLDTPHVAEARRALLEIYIREKEWPRAIEVARLLADELGARGDALVAHFLCEQALKEHSRGESEAARTHLAQALKTDRRSARAAIVSGDLREAAGDLAGALDAWREVENRSPAHLALVAERMLKAHRALNRPDEGLQALRGLYGRVPSTDLLNLLFHATLEQEGIAAAHELIRDEMRKTPTLTGLDDLLESLVLTAPPERRAELQIVKNLLQQHVLKTAVYRCGHCGFQARQFFWQCPACAEWDTFPPQRLEA